MFDREQDIMVYCQDMVLNEEGDTRTIKILGKIAYSLDMILQFTVDYPTASLDRRLPIL